MLIKSFWRFRVHLAAIQSLMIGLLSGVAVVSIDLFWVIILVILQAYRLIIYLRIAENRINLDHLRRISIRSEIVLTGSSFILLLSWVYKTEFSSSSMIVAIALLQVLIATIFLRHFLHIKKLTKTPNIRKHRADYELPTLSVAIPARNETNELTDCLQAVMKSDYPKLEVLVLDDCSQDNTSDIIRGFAHRGVRFIKGTPPPEHWVAKNHAYQELLKEASGEYILFLGSDARVGSSYFRHLIEYVISNKASMVSVLPNRQDLLNNNYLLLPMRYWRELVWPKSLHKTPPALSTCWVINRDKLLEIGGFRGLRQSIRPEWPIAQACLPHYRFIRSSSSMEIASIKTIKSQWNTAVRTRYPELHKKPESVAFTSLWMLLILFGPIITTFAGIYFYDALLISLGIISLSMLLAIHIQLLKMVQNKIGILPIFLYPYAVIFEIVTINYSMWQYEFGTVTWRGRNICLPVIDIRPRLPSVSPVVADLEHKS